MTPAERDRIAEAAARVAADAPPVRPELADMLRRDRCPIVAQRTKGEAA